MSLLSNQNPKISLVAIAIDEGIHGYREKTLMKASDFCSKISVTLNVFSYKEEFGLTLDEMLKRLDVKPCTICGIFRRYLLNKKSRDMGLTKLATGHNLDDECQSIMMNQFKNNIEASARLGPKVGVADHISFVQRIKPLYLCTEKEVMTYAFLKGFVDAFKECPNASQSYRAKIRDMLNGMEHDFPGTKNAIVNSFIEMLPLLKERFKSGTIRLCARCQEPSSKEVCNACNYVERLLLKKP